MSEERKVKGSLVGIDRILRSWIRKINRYSLIFLNAFMLMVEPRMAKMLDLTGGQRSDEYWQDGKDLVRNGSNLSSMRQ